MVNEKTQEKVNYCLEKELTDLHKHYKYANATQFLRGLLLAAQRLKNEPYFRSVMDHFKEKTLQKPGGSKKGEKE